MKGILTFSNILFLIFFLIAIVTLSPLIAISLGFVYSFIYSDYSQSISSRINTIPLQIGIVLLGFTISLTTLMPIISSYVWWILFFIIFSFILSFARFKTKYFIGIWIINMRSNCYSPYRTIN